MLIEISVRIYVSFTLNHIFLGLNEVCYCTVKNFTCQ